MYEPRSPRRNSHRSGDRLKAEAFNAPAVAKPRGLSFGLIALTIALLALARPAAAQQYTAVRLQPQGFTGSRALGVSGAQQVGTVTVPLNGVPHERAVLWSGTSASAVNLNPDGFYRSFAKATDGVRQVGYGGGPATGGCYFYTDYGYSCGSHALLWSGTAESVVDLHPPTDFYYSAAYGIHGNQQVGWGYFSKYIIGYGRMAGNHALLWSGTAASVVDLHPKFAGTIGDSVALGIFGGQQVGWTESSGALSGQSLAHSVPHATLWLGTAESAVDINPPGFEGSVAYGTSGTQHVGWGYKQYPTEKYLTYGLYCNPLDICVVGCDYNPYCYLNKVFGLRTFDVETHALLWFGNTVGAIDLHPVDATLSVDVSTIDLHPEGFTQTMALATNGSQQVGS
ncbi:MAG TPA: hypothetical protein VD968_16115, partial [Pyrinomonadaceae bacterium]|nr:hypothetical protein [Pyrinomonadaceae bacterium]